ncbi:matrixin family metalloprotease [Candidatus Curtissbacteria bacterium]|nr:matrixin family metalloprotease [Candidatus Curtissbacteria bacterium]
MRKLAFLLFLVGVIAVLSPQAVASLQEIVKRLNPCTQPIHYRIETVDSRFGISHDKFLQDIQKAEAVWETPLGRDLFVYDPKGDLSINMVYDDRQTKSSQISKLENQLKLNEQDIKPQVADYQKRSAQFKEKVQNLNAEIAKWNSQGGAPPDQFQKLNQEQQDLKKEAADLNAVAKSLNLSADQYNSTVDNLNGQINQFNSELVTKPEEGLFLGSDNRIEIYFYYNDSELVHTLAHEMGHALGMQHVNTQKAIMFPQTTQTTAATQADINELKTACKISN